MGENDFYPEKPELIEKVSKKNTRNTIFSLLLFIITFSLIGSNDYTFIFYLVSVLIIHELGHFLFMKKFGYTNVKMLFIPLMGAFVEGKKEEYHQKESLIVLLAGPIPGIIVGLFLLYYGVEWKLEWMNDLAFLFLFLNILNLLPLDPLDGGQILKLLINKSPELFQLIFSFISSLIMIGIGWYYELWLLVIFGFIMGLRVRTIQKNYLIHKELNKDKINYNINYKQLTNKDFAKIKQFVLDFTPALRKYIGQIDEETLNPIIADQVNNILVTPLKKNASILFKVFVLIIWISAFISPFILINHLGFLEF
jgi:stage IV sporulation protein FB